MPSIQLISLSGKYFLFMINGIRFLFGNNGQFKLF